MGSRQLIIHIGTEKTGTTTLQNFLHHNAKVLAEHGEVAAEFVVVDHHERRAVFLREGLELGLGHDEQKCCCVLGAFSQSHKLNLRTQPRSDRRYSIGE